MKTVEGSELVEPGVRPYQFDYMFLGFSGSWYGLSIYLYSVISNLTSKVSELMYQCPLEK